MGKSQVARGGRRFIQLCGPVPFILLGVIFVAYRFIYRTVRLFFDRGRGIVPSAQKFEAKVPTVINAQISPGFCSPLFDSPSTYAVIVSGFLPLSILRANAKCFSCASF